MKLAALSKNRYTCAVATGNGFDVSESYSITRSESYKTFLAL